jgi:hypothetical protein
MKSLVQLLFFAALFTACQNPTPAPVKPATTDITTVLQHKYWVIKSFNDALFAPNITDTLANLPCAELVFGKGDTVYITACLSDAGRGIYKIANNTLQIVWEGFENKTCTGTFDDKTGILHVTSPDSTNTAWPTDFVAQDGIDVNNMDNITVNLGRKRLAGNYTKITEKGEMAIASLYELHADGTHVNFGDFDTYEPWPSGIGSGFIQNPQYPIMYLVKKGKENYPTAAAWQLHGDTLRIWETKNIGAQGDLPEYKVTKLQGAYLKSK